MVERETYRQCLELRQQVYPAFADVSIDYDAIAQQLPDNGVPEGIVSCATHMPEVEAIKLTMDQVVQRTRNGEVEEPHYAGYRQQQSAQPTYSRASFCDALPEARNKHHSLQPPARRTH